MTTMKTPAPDIDFNTSMSEADFKQELYKEIHTAEQEVAKVLIEALQITRGVSDYTVQVFKKYPNLPSIEPAKKTVLAVSQGLRECAAKVSAEAACTPKTVAEIDLNVQMAIITAVGEFATIMSKIESLLAEISPLTEVLMKDIAIEEGKTK